MSRGSPVPTGRINLPREAKPKKETRILVFAEGRQAEEARRAGAHTVGGLELIESVGSTIAYVEKSAYGTLVGCNREVQQLHYYTVHYQSYSWYRFQARPCARPSWTHAF